MKTKALTKSESSSKTVQTKTSRAASLKVGKLAAESNLELAPVHLPESRRMPEASVTVVEARIDVGFGNQLFIRGEGPGLSWDQGVPLTCVDGQTWRWMSSGDESIIFKLLLNDEQWAQGENIEILPGSKLEVVPVF